MHHPPHIERSPWNTASWGGSSDTTPMELTALGDHLRTCRTSHGRLFAMRCGVERVGRFAAARFVTTLSVLLVLLTGAGWLAR